MRGLHKHPLRVAGRLLWLVGELILAALRFVYWCVLRPKGSPLAARAFWLQRSSQRFVRLFGLTARVSGPIPSSGLLVCNHLGYLDILVLAATAPAVFVSKSEVRHWPVFGWFASLAGTLYVDREKRTQAGHTAEKIRAVLDTGALVVLFPEGTSSDGITILPFKSALLEPATRQAHPLTVGLIRYELSDGDVSEEVCYWKDMTFAPHVLNLLSKRAVQAFVQFKRLPGVSADRKELARQLRSEILKLKEAPDELAQPQAP